MISSEISERIMLYGSTVLGVLLVSSPGLPALIEAARRDRDADFATGARHDIGIGDRRLQRSRAKGSPTMNSACWWIGSTRCWPASSRATTTLRNALRDREEALRDAERARERFRFMAESMPQKIFTARPSGDMDYFNRQWTEFTGLPFEQIKNWGWTQFVHPDDLEANVRAWRQSIETGEPFHFQHRFRRADGEYRWHLSRAHAMRDADGDISMWIGSNTDIHEQKEKEEELRRANDDLQQFAYSASHDLQEPIRNVAVYSEIVAKRYHNVLDADGQQFLGFLQEGGRRLATLINDLLAYTRAGVAQVNEKPVAASAVLRHALSSLAEAIRENDAAVT